MITLSIEQMITKKLSLYTGIRTKTEDEALHNEAYDRVFLETLTFLNENKLSPDTKQNENSQISPQEMLGSTLIKLQSIPNWEQKLLIRLNHYLDNWIISGK